MLPRNNLNCFVPRPLKTALAVRGKTTGLPVEHLVQASLAQYLDAPIHTLFQVSTSGSLVAGVFDSAVSVEDLLRHGNFGLGTLAALDGEMVVLEGIAFQARGGGSIRPVTGRVGVAIATSGPGTYNLITGMATAHKEGESLPALGGAVATSESLNQIHQNMDSVSVCQSVTKYSASVDSPETTSEVISNAFRAAESSRPGAAFVSLPKDIMGMAAQSIGNGVGGLIGWRGVSFPFQPVAHRCFPW